MTMTERTLFEDTTRLIKKILNELVEGGNAGAHWGPSKVESPKYSSLSVFPEYIEAASCVHPREGWSQNQKLWIAGLPSSLTEPIK